ncbi:hypothetical protein HZC32_00530 [Candidatus Woesearchaeota archaeon]|nr:hypothetical protein [Candidatus Woesearchaeota archaeon]
MIKKLDDLVSLGKKLVMPVVAAAVMGSSAGCAVTYAKRDYDKYPAYREEIAMHNMQEIAKDICYMYFDVRPYPQCKSLTFDETGIYYIGRNYSGFGKHSSIKNKDYYIKWEDIYHVEVESILKNQPISVLDGPVGYYKVKINGEEIEIGGLEGRKQANDFAEGLRIKVEEHKKRINKK